MKSYLATGSYTIGPWSNIRGRASQNILGVNQAAGSTGSAASIALKAAGGLRSQSDLLSSAVRRVTAAGARFLNERPVWGTASSSGNDEDGRNLAESGRTAL